MAGERPAEHAPSPPRSHRTGGGRERAFFGRGRKTHVSGRSSRKRRECHQLPLCQHTRKIMAVTIDIESPQLDALIAKLSSFPARLGETIKAAMNSVGPTVLGEITEQ